MPMDIPTVESLMRGERRPNQLQVETLPAHAIGLGHPIA